MNVWWKISKYVHVSTSDVIQRQTTATTFTTGPLAVWTRTGRWPPFFPSLAATLGGRHVIPYPEVGGPFSACMWKHLLYYNLCSYVIMVCVCVCCSDEGELVPDSRPAPIRLASPCRPARKRRTIYTAGRPPWYDSQGQMVDAFVIGESLEPA